MARPLPQSIASRLQSLSSSDERLAALKALKNELIGHEEKKNQYVRAGLLRHLTDVLASHKGIGGNTPNRHHGRSEQEDVRLQAIIVVGSIAHGGAPYVSPLYCCGVLPPVLDALSLHDTPPDTLLAALRTLNTVVDAISLQHPLRRLHPDVLTDLLYTKKHLYSLAEVLSQSSPFWTVQQQISLAATLIAKTCQDEHHRCLLEQAGIFGILASKLTSFVIATGCSSSTSDGYGQDLPLPATEKAELAPIVEAVCAIAKTSRPRWICFLSYPVIRAVFSKRETDISSHYNACNLRQHPIESLIPHTQPSQRSLPNTSSFPPLDIIGTSSQSTLRPFGFPIDSSDAISDDESPLIPWLIFVARAEPGEVARLVVLQTVTYLYRCGLTHKRREAEFSTLLVPLLVNMLESPSNTQRELPTNATLARGVNKILVEEKAPAVLASLVDDSTELQRAAIDAGAVKKLSQILKKSFDPLPPSASAALWQPDAEADQITMDDVPVLGYFGLSHAASHVTKLREATLTGLAAMGSLRDEYRKSIIDNGIISFIIQSLKPYGIESSSQRKDEREIISPPQVVTENTKDVIVAACQLARGLSRSVSTLRTSLMDAGLAPPLFVLLKHQDIQIQIEATAVVCNLVLDFSPMREAIVEGGILRILCEHARSMNPSLLLNSIWALKHLVLNSPNPLKMKCLEELGPGWLKQIICNGSEDLHITRDRESNFSTSIGLGTPNAAGMHVDILNAAETESNGSTQNEDDEGDVRMSDSEPENRHTRPKRTPNPPSSRAGSLLAMRPTVNDLNIQTQGLEVIRNLICGQGATEMIDFLFAEFGQEKLFDLLRNKLNLRASGGKSDTRRASSIITPQPYSQRGNLSKSYLQAISEIKISVLYVLIHIAAGLPRHRQILIAQTELLKSILPLFTHEKRELRSCCAWLCINMTWVDDNSEERNTKARVRELTKLGYLERLKLLENDSELDVKERTKTAVHQMATNLGR